MPESGLGSNKEHDAIFPACSSGIVLEIISNVTGGSVDGVCDLWKLKGGSQQKSPIYPEPYCSCRAKGDAGPPIWFRRKSKKLQLRGEKNKHPNLPTYQCNIKAAKLLWKQQPLPQLSLRSADNKIWMTA